MKPGRELDALVAEKVWPECSVAMAAIGENDEDVLSVWKLNGERNWLPLPHYSTSIADAWLVVEKFPDALGYFAIDHTHGSGKVGIWLNPQDFGEFPPDVMGETAPHAICLAALKAVGVEEP